MSKIAYTYSIVKYVHDPATGEMLNVGVLLYAPQVRYFGYQLELRFKRLLDTFADFDGDHYRRTLRQFELDLHRLWEDLSGGLPGMSDLPPDVGMLASQVWPDPDLSFRIGPTLAGITDDPEQALKAISGRMVASQYASTWRASDSEQRSTRDGRECRQPAVRTGQIKVMAQATLTHILDEIKTLKPEELKEVERAARALREPAEKEAEREAVLRVLEETGLVNDVKRPPMHVTQERTTVPIQGKPLSETIIEERR